MKHYAGTAAAAASLMILITATSASGAGLHVCDRLAAHPSDAQRVANAVPYDVLKTQLPEAISACRRAVDENPDVARFEFQLGRALDADGQLDEAFKWFRATAERDYTAAMFYLALAFDEGNGTSKDQGRANFWYRKAADRGDISAMWNLAINLNDALGGPHDPAGAAKYLVKAYLGGHDKAAEAFDAKLNSWREGTRREIQQILHKAGHYDGPINGEFDDASLGAAQAYLQAETGAADRTADQDQDTSSPATRAPVAREISQNVGLQDCDRLAAHASDMQRVTNAVRFADLKARVTDAIAACREATSTYPGVSRFEYQLGRALSADGGHAEAVEWFTKAAERDYVAAMFNLAVAYDEGQGVERDQATANQWYRKAADKGRSDAMWNLAINLDKGLGEARKPAESAKYVLMAYKAGHERTTESLDQGLESWEDETRREIQKILRDAGHYAGEITGVIDDATRDAARAYREAA